MRSWTRNSKGKSEDPKNLNVVRREINMGLESSELYKNGIRIRNFKLPLLFPIILGEEGRHSRRYSIRRLP
ncbi:hypothetical protein PILCRDRAFT_821821 [Piloderma croceum F 1598]|uniref:Uncharacterized protein n=1 Tax=Piloderma croceum (strain F 1598) TaxID=765440 RepID=A0A0C3B415_PILCF|nr:hypothetical protein PILCRDRAFT_821821 [Piloderma croceum F 1598]